MDTEIEHLLNQYLKDNQFRLTKRTLRKYQKYIQEFFIFTCQSYKDVEASDIRQWLMYSRNLGLTTETIRGKIIALRSIFTYLVEEEILDKNPASSVPLPKKEVQIPRYLTEYQLQHLRNILVSKRERAIIETFYATGVRRSELVGIKREDISWQERSMIIRKGKGGKDRIVFFTRLCQEALQDYLNERDDHHSQLFLNSKGRPISNRVLYSMFYYLSELFGSKVTPHMLRHTFAAHCIQKGIPLAGVQDLLGHSRYEDTKVYIKLYDKARKEKFDYYL